MENKEIKWQPHGKICMRCGAQNPDGHDICGGCGEQSNEPEEKELSKDLHEVREEIKKSLG